MDLLKIKGPSFIKQLDIKELEALAADIRAFLITSTSNSGGHIGPNLGVVELTIALHYTFTSPKDKFIWDVGHQSYVHKILTGRASKFETLRQHGGLDGFPKRKESKHDVFETGHSSTSLSAAAGMVIARDIKQEGFYVIPVIGDGALTGGMALEALNHIGDMGKDMIVILNDNDMSIAPNVGALQSVLRKLRKSDKFNPTRKELDKMIRKVPTTGEELADATEKIKDSVKHLLVEGTFFEELGFMYLGPVDGHNLQDIITHLEIAKRIKGPVLLHIVTKKGKGYQPAELDERGTWHGTGPYKVETGSFIKPVVSAPSWSSIISKELMRLAAEDERIVAITPAMPVGSKLEKFAAAFPERFFDVGIAEQHATTMAAGLAIQGMKPFLAIYSTFLQRAYDQVVHDVCRQKLNVIFGIDRAGLVGADGETHQGVFDISFLSSIPNMIITMPKDEAEAKQLMDTAFAYDKGPIAIRYPRGNGPGVKPNLSTELIPIGEWETVIEPVDAVILTFGPTVPLALEAAKRLSAAGKQVGVINARFIKPLDEALLHQIMQLNIPILTVEESLLKGGFGASVLEFMELNNYTNLSLHRIGFPDAFIHHGSVKLILESYGISESGIVLKINEMLAQSEKLRAKRL
ncbi:1-deoxy-D-xylulose-5-phosphate synthase [Listeria ivanovii]|uniref:1-deoxy-D-xylulose-5-phosphate synthase n=1 Tax=Listeria ivanovii (strain ATCC BAA-678 / PAM 55) TaxID=881621 RepID=G2Z8A4_LISIP|nr:1-deoxy-D-xylulose-5-phosphate synthase [Listeria ivanovii]AHI55860.1 1-deoxy-D-xylulose-5-phosphate synthase [Listeria ivanovii WSLC3009]MBC1760035.1 1-deoxy-D-xylulose-5-phosphate synthase [Listeria ivanovii]MBK3914543.1 1-deoxy-D-xylulose-5-phosphate synthase [Listeria ivanovii subsp. ivanovii]MBK3921559.1 1-deoxy-D-xylulose-5-phosphate synthase [Listeria ivanovii subsp. ivanovii]MBK3926723.1 1-deoxy-D-xylulose-5-phosphate synthase [Listeria ivanovii subsp. ivanovii]